MLVADAPHNHERRAIAEVRGEAGQRDPAGQQFALLAHVLDGVVGEALERLADLQAPRVGFRADALQIEHLPACERLARRITSASARPPSHGSIRTVRGSPSETRVEQRVVGQVDEQDARFDEQLGPEVGIGAAGGGAAVEYRDRARGDQLLGRDPVDVEVVDQRDVAAERDA